jgi:hypothetical protein
LTATANEPGELLLYTTAPAELITMIEPAEGGGSTDALPNWKLKANVNMPIRSTINTILVIALDFIISPLFQRTALVLITLISFREKSYIESN